MEIFSKFKNIFTKENPVSRAVTLMLQQGRGVSTKTNLESLAREGFMLNAIVFACVKEIASAAAGVPWTLSRRTRSGLEDIHSHPLLDLIRKPNPRQGQYDYVNELVSSQFIFGNSYQTKVGPDNRPPRELYILKPQRMKVLPHPIELIEGYEYSVGQSKKKFDRDEILHLLEYHPTDDFYGLSPIQVAGMNIDKMNEGDKWNANLLKNSAVPSGTMVANKKLTDTQFDRFKNQIKEKLQGVKNAGEFLLLEEAEWKGMGFNPKDMDWNEGLKNAALQIAIVFNIPPELIGLNPATYQNRKEARKALYTEVVCPFLTRFRDGLNGWLVPLYGDNLFLDFNKDGIEALSEDQESLWKRANESDFLEINEKRRMVGFDDHEHGNTIMQQLNKIPIEDVVAGVNEEESNLGGDEDEKCLHDCLESKSNFEIEGKAFSPSERKRFRKQLVATIRLRNQFEKKYKRRIKTFLDSEAVEIFKAYKQDQVNGPFQAVENNQEKLFNLLELLNRDVLRVFGKQTLDGLKDYPEIFETKQDEDVALDLFEDLAIQFAKRNAGETVKNISDSTQKEIRSIISLGVDKGLGIDVIAQSLRDGLNGINAVRSRTIARTEIHNAQNEAQLESVNALGRDDLEKGWMWSGKSRTEHEFVDGVWVALKEFFIVAGKQMQRPGDKNGGAENVINCVCTLVFRLIKN